MTEEQIQLTKKLLSEAEEYFCNHETAPTEDWFRNLYLMDGSHMILVEEGWLPASDRMDYEPDEILDEVNAPTQPT
jgi:hypothetical protein